MKLIIASEHSSRPQTQSLFEVQMEGGSPWYGYIWINDEIYALSIKTDEDGAHTGYELEPVK